ncbi:MAG TPA: hypothetical protein VJ840_18580 [Gemmatimonadaceae bacterium]|nr:hypothetical protein [Gemmatimonadaceae bacterium]
MSDVNQDPVQTAYEQLQAAEPPAPVVPNGQTVAPVVAAVASSSPAGGAVGGAPDATHSPQPDAAAVADGSAASLESKAAAEGEDLTAHAEAAAGLGAEVGTDILKHIHDRVEYYVSRLEAGLHVPIDDARELLRKIKSIL